ncbi:hypothetical protein [Corynebacterium pseudotuberculosis]|uniref:hypothetical protein n=1 Tax=Corynebacterium pseudotuberculosis TaxID=1719 RepID=UPI001E48D323|nr:hypothetical protein [Corynebacterium pseudotuberculosis]
MEDSQTEQGHQFILMLRENIFFKLQNNQLPFYEFTVLHAAMQTQQLLSLLQEVKEASSIN